MTDRGNRSLEEHIDYLVDVFFDEYVSLSDSRLVRNMAHRKTCKEIGKTGDTAGFVFMYFGNKNPRWHVDTRN